jgi:hypothetical protein
MCLWLFKQTTVVGFTPCVSNTQVCQQPTSPPDKSCGIGPPSISYFENGQGVIMQTTGGFVGCGTVSRSSTINVKCSTTSGRQDQSVDLVIESMFILLI